MQLDVDVSPPADSIKINCQYHKCPNKHFLTSDFWSSMYFGQVTYIQKVMHKSPLCIRTGGLKNHTNYWTIPNIRII